jgi:hypothetical protein
MLATEEAKVVVEDVSVHNRFSSNPPPYTSRSVDTAGAATGTGTTVIESFLSLPPPFPSHDSGLGLTEEEQQEREEMAVFETSQQQQHVTIRANDSFFHSSIQYDDDNNNNNNDDDEEDMMIHDLYGIDISGTATGSTTMEDGGNDTGGVSFLPPPVPFPMSFQSHQHTSDHDQHENSNSNNNTVLHGSGLQQQQQPPAVMPISAHFPSNSQSGLATMIPQSWLQQPQLQHHHQQQQQQGSPQTLTSALPMCQLLTSLNQLAAVSTTPQDFQAILQSLGLPQAVLMAAAMSLAQVTTTPASSYSTSTSSNFGLSSQQDQQQQTSEVSYQQHMIMQQWIAQQQQQLCQLQHLQAGQVGILNASHVPGYGMVSPLNAMQQPVSYILQTQQQPQYPSSIDSTKHETSTMIDLHDKSHLQHVDPKGATHEHTNVSKNTTILNNTNGQPVQNNTHQSADAITDNTTTVKVNQNSSVNVHINDSKKNDNTNASSNPIMDGKPVQTKQQSMSTSKTATSPQPSNFPPLRLDNTKLHSTSTDCELSMATSKKVNPPFVNNNAIKTSRSTEPSSNCNNQSNFQCTGDALKEQERTHSACKHNNIITVKSSKSVSDDSNGDFQKLPTCTIILPCRARGMPSDHNFKVRRIIDNRLLCLFSFFTCFVPSSNITVLSVFVSFGFDAKERSLCHPTGRPTWSRTCVLSRGMSSSW